MNIIYIHYNIHIMVVTKKVIKSKTKGKSKGKSKSKVKAKTKAKTNAKVKTSRVIVKSKKKRMNLKSKEITSSIEDYTASEISKGKILNNNHIVKEQSNIKRERKMYSKMIKNISVDKLYSNRFSHVYLYDEISNESVLRVQLEIDKLSRLGKEDIDNKDDDGTIYTLSKPIVLHLNSPGGDLNAGLALSTIICNSKIPIIVVNEGTSASAATFVTVTAPIRFIMKFSVMLLHQYSESASDKYEGLKFNIKIGDEIMETIFRLYVKNSNLSYSALKNILKHDIFLDSNTIMKYGLADKMLGLKSKKYTKDRQFKKYFNKYPYLKLTAKKYKDHNYVRNVIFLYRNQSDIDSTNSYNRSLSIVKHLHYSFITVSESLPIFIRINDNTSVDYFQDIFEIIPVLNAIMISKIPIYVIFDGPVRNYSVLIGLVAYKCFMHENSYILFDYTTQMVEMDRYVDVVQNTLLERKYLTNILKKYTQIPKKIIDNFFDDRIYFNSKKALQYDIVDDIISECKTKK